MISFEAFDSIMKRMEAADLKVIELYRTLGGAEVLFDLCSTDTTVELLEHIFDDSDRWISYWMYELDYGKDWHEGCATIDGKDLKLQTSRDLYDFLVREEGGGNG